jgi:hypothetical protein
MFENVKGESVEKLSDADKALINANAEKRWNDIHGQTDGM